MKTKTYAIASALVASALAMAAWSGAHTSPKSAPSQAQALPTSHRSPSTKAITRQQGVETPADAALTNEINDAYGNGVRARQEGKFALAIQGFRKAQQLDPSSPMLMEALAKAYDANGQVNDARIEYREALRHRPNQFSSVWIDARNLARYGELCEKAGDKAEAMKAYQTACSGEVDNDHETPIYARTSDLAGLRAAAHGRAGVRAKSHGEDVKAETEFRLAAASDPQNWAIHCHLGMVLNSLARYQEADNEFVLAQKYGGRSSHVVTWHRSELSRRLSKPKYFGYVNGKLTEIPKPPSDEEALAKLRAEEKRKDAKAPPATPYQLKQALKGIQLAKTQSAKDPERLKQLENAERILQGALRKAESNPANKGD